MTVYHLSAECFPVAKVGGLGDVVGALPKYQRELGVNANVVLPYYDRPFVQKGEFQLVHSGVIGLGASNFPFEILQERQDTLGFRLFLIRIQGLLDRPEVYMYPDEREQFIAFQLAFLQWLIDTNQKPDVVHCHDHHTGLVPFFMYSSPLYRALSRVATVFTVHNGQYQGWMGWEKFRLLPETDSWKNGQLDWNGSINCLAAAIKCCWAFTTVSPGYMQELMIEANGLQGLFQTERSKGSGILNGIDTGVWDPATDTALPENYTAKTASAGKKASKKALCDQFGLAVAKPLFAFIGRLVGEKGADLLPQYFERCLQDFAGQVNFLVLGSGEPEVERQLLQLKEAFKGSYNVYIGYNEQLSHQIYAGADFLLMPSRVEPCGLNQLYSLRYGTVPVVRKTGGLSDTVVDIRTESGSGINFINADVQEMAYATGRAISLFYDKNSFGALQKKIMQLDHSWNTSAKKYIDLYTSLLNP